MSVFDTNSVTQNPSKHHVVYVALVRRNDFSAILDNPTQNMMSPSCVARGFTTPLNDRVVALALRKSTSLTRNPSPNYHPDTLRNS